MEETFLMSKKELNQMPVFEKLRDNEIEQVEAAKKLNLTTRQVRRKLKEFKKKGPKSLIHGLRGRKGSHCIDPKLKKKALDLLKGKEEYEDLKPTFASETLEKRHNLKIKPDTLRNVMIEEGLWKPKKRKPSHKERRERMENFGEMVQLDGSHHRWFEKRGPELCLVAFIDDATSKTLQVKFGQQETTKLVMEATKEYLKNYGRPLKFYSDKGKVFKVNQFNEDNEFVTQYKRAVEEELNIEMIFAHSPEAKGRVERLFNTLQDRLIKEMRIEKISTIEEANYFANNVYLPEHNEKFAVEPKKKADLHRAIKDYNLDDVLCIKSERVLRNDYTISYENRLFQVKEKQPVFIQPGKPISVFERFDDTISLVKGQEKLKFKEIEERPKKKEKEVEFKAPKKNKWKPSKDHPWRQY